MADHDRDAGSRGDEEAPRDPNRPEGHAETLRNAAEDTQVLPDPSPDPAHAIGPAAPAAPSGHPVSPPVRPVPPPPQPGTFRDFVRQKPAQIIGAGLLGLLAGVLIGALAVVMLTAWADHRAGSRDHSGWDHPRWGDSRVHPGYPGYPGFHECRPVPGGMFCGPAGRPGLAPSPTMPPPKPVPSVTVTAIPTRTG
ncbi:hypothetical protein [Nonomuraea sp. SBT364]|uniref:hypothetical protein n=1 Tax=Nonomuraea sp. SBT364 TaxID=1580530 RepID=UPI00066ECD84|nr:hypothetical protein [Nonomuraea sp. SBT364]